MKMLNEKGSAAVVICLLMTAIMGVAALVTDIGMVYAERVKLSNALDSAALAAALELPGNGGQAIAVAKDYLQKNGVDPAETTITLGTGNKSIKIEGTKNVKHLFAQVIGIESSDVHARAMAVIAPVKSVKGIKPFAVEAFDYTYGDQVTLKVGGGYGSYGNYGAIALGGTGASNFKEKALYGYSGTISVGDFLETETGNMSGATNAIKNYINSENSTFDNFPRDSVRVWTLPLVESLDVTGRDKVEVIGFAVFYVEAVQNSSGKMEITGRFIRYALNSVTDESLDDTGAYGIRLSRYQEG